ncbi:MAG: hypothetical protein MI861_05240 [Pirellulales bacterium]|nr:hypothetical protein [Pirellulales bacterium]
MPPIAYGAAMGASPPRQEANMFAVALADRNRVISKPPPLPIARRTLQPRDALGPWDAPGRPVQTADCQPLQGANNDPQKFAL